MEDSESLPRSFVASMAATTFVVYLNHLQMTDFTDSLTLFWSDATFTRSAHVV